VKAIQKILTVLLLYVSGAWGAEKSELQFVDVRNVMEKLFNQHIETKKITPTVVKRSFKVFIKQFDPQKIYLTQQEAKPFLELTPVQIEQIIAHYFTDKYPEYEAINKAINKAICRSREWRLEFYKDFIEKGEALQARLCDNVSEYAESLELLKCRIRQQLFFRFMLENKLNSVDFWTEERRKKVCDLYEKRISRFESLYSFSNNNEAHLVMHILKAVAKSLDAHTDVFSQEEACGMRASLEKQFVGIGIAFRDGLEGIEVTDFIKNGPAERSRKISIGDILVKVGDNCVNYDSYHKVFNWLKGKEGEAVALKFRRGNDHFNVRVKREIITLEEQRLTYETEPFAAGVIGKLTLPAFYESSNFSCEKDMRAALKAMQKEGPLLGVVLDIRENPGGFLNQAVKVCGIFIRNGIVIASKSSEGEVKYIRNINPNFCYTIPLVIVTSKCSASAAEVVSQTLKDFGVAIVVGDKRSYGKGTIQSQTVTNPQARTPFKVTIGKYYTPSGKSTQLVGVQPDIEVPSIYAPYRIGEKYLEFPLPNDTISPLYQDPLTDIAEHNRVWFDRNYTPYLQQKELRWIKIIPLLQENSRIRLNNDPDFQLFLKKIDKKDLSVQNIKENDLQVEEAVNILKDMISLQL
jgi:carboxyl-terminal processing protease